MGWDASSRPSTFPTSYLAPGSLDAHIDSSLYTLSGLASTECFLLLVPEEEPDFFLGILFPLRKSSPLESGVGLPVVVYCCFLEIHSYLRAYLKTPSTWLFCHLASFPFSSIDYYKLPHPIYWRHWNLSHDHLPHAEVYLSLRIFQHPWRHT